MTLSKRHSACLDLHLTTWALTVWPGKAFWTNTTNGPFSVSTRAMPFPPKGHVSDGQFQHLTLVKRSFDATVSSHATKVQGE